MEEGCRSEILYSQRGKVTNVIVISIGGAACFPGLNERLSQKIAETLLRTEAEGRHVGENLTPSRSAGDTAPFTKNNDFSIQNMENNLFSNC